MNDEVTGRLEGWYFKPITEEEGIFWGFVYEDSKDRFNDGVFMHTAGVKIGEFKSGDVITTRNSTYLLGETMADLLARSTDVVLGGTFGYEKSQADKAFLQS